MTAKKKWKMESNLKRRWLRALRGNKYSQTQQTMNRTTDGDYPAGFCCLGVLMDLIDPKGWVPDERDPTLCRTRAGTKTRWYRDVPPVKVIPSDVAGELATKNDGGTSFEIIADWIEENL